VVKSLNQHLVALKSVALVILSSVIVFPAQADVLAYDFNGASRTFFTDHAGITVGFRFDVLKPFTVTALGNYWDGTFTEDHPIGLWDTVANLIVSNDVTAADPLSGSFRFAPIAPTTLSVGTYVIGEFTINDHWSFTLGPKGSGEIFDPRISFLGGQESTPLGGASLQFPNFGPENGDFFMGPNFLIGAGVPAVPEPATSVLFGSALAMVAWKARKRFRI
jgi:hypothetical protein